MKIFISWSGPLSHKLALAVADWLKLINQNFQPFMSSEDIQKGSRWLTDVSKELQDTHFGILCLTMDNLQAPWICFEAGALSKQVQSSRVAPILFGVQPSDVHGPLTQFQATKFELDDLVKLAKSINAACDQPRDDRSLEKMLNMSWQGLQPEIQKILASVPTAPADSRAGNRIAETNKTESILEEMLVLVRQQSQVLSDPEAMLPTRNLERALQRIQNRDNPILNGHHPVWDEVSSSLRELDRLVSKWRSGPDPTTAIATADLLGSLEVAFEYMSRSSGRRSSFEGEHYRKPPPRRPPPLPTAPSVNLAEYEQLRQKLPVKSGDPSEGDTPKDIAPSLPGDWTLSQDPDEPFAFRRVRTKPPT